MSKQIKTTIYLPIEVVVPETSHIADLIEQHNVSLDKVQKMMLSSVLDAAQGRIQEVLDYVCCDQRTGQVRDDQTRMTLVHPGVLA